MDGQTGPYLFNAVNARNLVIEHLDTKPLNYAIEFVVTSTQNWSTLDLANQL